VKYIVRYWGQIKRSAGASEETIELDTEPTIADLLERLASRHDETFRMLVLDDAGRPRPSLVVIVDDEQLPLDSSRRLPDGASVTLLPPIAGGTPT